jgi:hypothetical protein
LAFAEPNMNRAGDRSRIPTIKEQQMKSIPTLVALAAAASLVVATGAFAQEQAPHAEKKAERHDHGKRGGHGCGGMHSHS